MKGKKKSWREFKTKDSGIQKQIRRRIRRACSILLLVEGIVLWKQGKIPGISVEGYQDSWGSRMEQGEYAVSEEMFGIRLRMEEGVIEFFCVTGDKK